MDKIYLTIQGDTWDSISFKLWGKETLMSQLIKANPNDIDTLIFSASIELIIPDIAAPALTIGIGIGELPPWI